MSDLRKQFEKETGKKIKVEKDFDCEQCANEILIDVWSDEYVFWLECKANEAANTTKPAWNMQNVSARFLESVVVDNIVASYGITEGQQTCLIAELAAEIRKL